MIFLLLCSCAVKKTGVNSNDLLNTNWNYSDIDAKYEVKFRKGGRLLITNPNDVTNDNDTWEQKGAIVYFYYNDKYSTYEGWFVGQDTIIGTGKNKNDKWEFKMVREK